MSGFLFVDGEDIDFIWNLLQEQQIIFHPNIAPLGRVDYTKFFVSKREKPFVLIIDRNILSSLLKFCEKGCLKNKEETQLIGLIMTWAELNNIKISAGLAIRERAAQMHSQEEGLIELQKFFEAFDAYPGQLWLQVAEGQRTEIPPIIYSQKHAENVTVDYSACGDHFKMALASLLHVVWLYRNQKMKPVDKVLGFYKWMCDYLLISEYLLVYAAMLFTGQEHIKAPKHANTNDIQRVIAGCENQAWDISHLTNWSTLYTKTEENDCEFLFATNDVLLKRIFINQHGPNGFNGLLFELFTKNEYNRIIDYIEERMQNRRKPNFGKDPQEYFQKLIEIEKQRLSDMIGA